MFLGCLAVAAVLTVSANAINPNRNPSENAAFLAVEGAAQCGSGKCWGGDAPTPSMMAVQTSSTSTTTTVPQTWSSKGEYFLLNVKYNYGLLFDGSPLKSEDYAKSAHSWGILTAMGKYIAKIYVSEPSKFHRLQFKDNGEGGAYKHLRIAPDPYLKQSDDTRYEIQMVSSEAEATKLEIRDSGVVDEFGASALWITAIHNGVRLVLSTAMRAGDDAYSTAFFKEVQDDESVDDWAYWLLGESVRQSSIWDQLVEKDTYYFYNKDQKGCIVPFYNGGDKCGINTEWGYKSRWTAIPQGSPWFKLKNLSEYCQEQMKTHGLTDNRMSSDGHTTKIQKGGVHNLQLMNNDYHKEFVVIRWDYNNANSKYRGEHHDIITDASGNGKDQDAKTNFQVVRIFGDSTSRAGVSSETGLPKL
eukprot:Selendium_serpulae@DN4536_c0_g1_i1.p1